MEEKLIELIEQGVVFVCYRDIHKFLNYAQSRLNKPIQGGACERHGQYFYI